MSDFTVLVATDDGLRTVGGELGEDLLAGREVTDVAFDGQRYVALAESRTVLAGTPDTGWTQLAQRPTGGLTCLRPTSSALLVGAEGGHLLRVEDGSLARVESFEQIEGREDWYTPWGGPPAVRSIAEAPDGTLYVNVHVGGIARSDDGGRTWSPTISIHRDVHQVATAPDSGQVLAACGVGGLAISDDLGATWSLQAGGLHGDYCRAVAVTDRAVLVSASTGPFSEHAALYLRPLDAQWLERADSGLPERAGGNIDTGWLVAEGERAALALRDGSVYLSSDGGDSWSREGQVHAPRALVIAG